MRTAILVFCVAVLGLSNAYACGDKYLVHGSRTKYKQTKGVKHVASVLIFHNPAVASETSHLDLAATLRKVGHKVELVEDKGALRKSLSQSKFDILVANVEDSGLAGEALTATASGATLLPVAYGTAAEKGQSADANTTKVLKLPAPQNAIVAAVEDTMRLRHGRRS